MNLFEKIEILAKEDYNVMRPSEHDACIKSLNVPALKKLKMHHINMAQNHEAVGNNNGLVQHHANLAHAYDTILKSVANKGKIR